VLGPKNSYQILNICTFAFLAINLLARFATIFNYPPYNELIAVLLAGVLMASLWAIRFPGYLPLYLGIFGFSFFLFGYGSPDIQSRMFELIVTCVGATLLLINVNYKQPPIGKNHVGTFLVLYSALSFFSLLVTPLRQMFNDMAYFGYSEFLFNFFIAETYSYYYPAGSILRLILFIILASEISRQAEKNKCLSHLFMGIVAGAIFSSFIGILDYYNMISIAWIRLGVPPTPGVLHSTFGNRNWFGEFLLAVVPFIMIGFLSPLTRKTTKVFIFLCLIICEIALILSGNKTGWVVYPVVLSLCWFLFYFSNNGQIRLSKIKVKDILKLAISIPLTLIASFIIIFYALMPIIDLIKQPNTQDYYLGEEASWQLLNSSLEQIRNGNLSGREICWAQGKLIAREAPIFGLGYETFQWHAYCLNAIPSSSFHQFISETQSLFLDSLTPHNTYISMLISGGWVGLSFWIILIMYTMLLLIADLIKNKRLMNIPVLISIISFHIFGIAESMQYIPMIWMLIFLNMAYAMTLPGDVLPFRIQRIASHLTRGGLILVAISIFIYGANFESSDLANKYGLRIYAMEPDFDRFSGFFQRLSRWQYGDYKWCGKKGAVNFPGGGDVALELKCQTPDAESNPLVVTVFHRGRVLDTIVFSSEGTVTKKFSLPAVNTSETLILDVSRTWIPHHNLKNFDRRQLGIGVRIIPAERQPVADNRRLTGRKYSS
jgi:O-antigen ligase